jgi:acyl-coenzyme A thioesterase PaaI-like protein
VGFESDTAVQPAGDGRWTAEIHSGWEIAGNANGGYLLALAARALTAATGRPDPVTVTAHYLAPGKPGPITITTDVVKRGRSLSTATAHLRSGDRPLLAVLGTLGDLTAAATGPERVDAAPPELPAPADCIRPAADAGLAPPFNARIDLRLHPDDAGFGTGMPSGEPRVRGWFRLPEEPTDTVGLLLAVDAFPPTIFNARLPVAWTPTVELTAHVRARPAPGWLRCAFTTRFVTGGFLEEDGEIWDATGRLVAQSRQLALLPRA